MGKKYMYSMCIKGGLREWQKVYVKEREREKKNAIMSWSVGHCSGPQCL